MNADLLCGIIAKHIEPVLMAFQMQIPAHRNVVPVGDITPCPHLLSRASIAVDAEAEYIRAHARKSPAVYKWQAAPEMEFLQQRRNCHAYGALGHKSYKFVGEESGWCVEQFAFLSCVRDRRIDVDPEPGDGAFSHSFECNGIAELPASGTDKSEDIDKRDMAEQRIGRR